MFGNLGSSREGSTHGGMRRNVSFTDMAGGQITDDPDRQTPRSREPSGHGGNLFKPMLSGLSGLASPVVSAGSTMKRNASWVWDWKNQTPPDSRGPSQHGGTVFAPCACPTDQTGAATGAEAPEEAPPAGMRRNSMSFLWDWGKYRNTPPGTPGSSAHGGNAFAPPKDGAEGEGEEEEEAPRDPLQPAIQPPRSMVKNMSIGSFMWDWGQSRVSPPSTPGSSKHGGDAFGGPMDVSDSTVVQKAPAQVSVVKLQTGRACTLP